MSKTCCLITLIEEAEVATVLLLVCWGFRNKIPQIGYPKQQTFIISQSWRLDVNDQGSGKLHSWQSSLPGL